MSKYNCDLHIHSCLSPCANEDMTPANIAAMAMLNKLQIVALTDHNTSKNCPAFFHHAEKFGIIPIAGMELTTSEEIHVVCLFRTLEDAMSFDEIVSKKRLKIKNKPEIFGNQHIMNLDDEIIGEEPYLLINASDISIYDAFDMVSKFSGVCYPAHIDRDSYGVISVLGAIPPDIPYNSFELYDESKLPLLSQKFEILNKMKRVVSSDAHYLENIAEKHCLIELPEVSNQGIVNFLIDYLAKE